MASSQQLSSWPAELGVPWPPAQTLPVNQVAPDVVVDGPVPGPAEEVRALHRRFHDRRT
ncbi:hypothetical protein [Streptomyces sp. NPDC001401]|uniref:hypothetical protein n=1 Tax=Streptomyces sp. NPDC001401 TaxID=3364570 RepID=UPI0036ACA88F